jgi:hypothetical protein
MGTGRKPTCHVRQQCVTPPLLTDRCHVWLRLEGIALEVVEDSSCRCECIAQAHIHGTSRVSGEYLAACQVG